MAEQKLRVYTNIEKAAITLIMMGTKRAANVFRHLSEDEIEKVTKAIASTSHISREEQSQVLESMKHEIAAGLGGGGGGDFAKSLLKLAVGEQKAKDIFMRVEGIIDEQRAASFNQLNSVDAKQLTNFLQQEHPQTVALILTHLETEQAARILIQLPAEMQTDVVMRMSKMEHTDPEIIKKVDEVIKEQVSSTYRESTTDLGGTKSVAEILNLVDRGTERHVLDTLDDQNPELGEEIKKLMFVFEDIVLVEDRSMQRVLQEIDSNDIAVAMKTASNEVKDKIFTNLSKRAAEMLKEEMEYMGPVRLKVVQEAQQRIVGTIRRLEEAGEIVIMGRGKGGEDEIIV